MDRQSRKPEDFSFVMDLFGELPSRPPSPPKRPQEPEEFVPEFYIKDVTRMRPINWSKIMLPPKTNPCLLLREKMESHENTNIDIVIGKRIFHSHLLLLQCYSKVFQQVKPIPIPKIQLPEEKINPEIFIMIHEWMLYEGTDIYKIINKFNILDVYEAAIFLGVTELEEQCLHIILDDNIYFEDKAFMLYLKARGSQAADIKMYMLPRLQRFFLTLVATKEFLDLSLEDVIAVLKSNYIIVWSEMEVFMAAIRWLMHDWQERKKYLVEVMSNVRFGLISPVELMQIKYSSIEEFLLVSENMEVTKMIEDGLAYSFLKSKHSNSLVVRGQQNVSTEEEDQKLLSFGLKEPHKRNWGGYSRVYTCYEEFLGLLNYCRLKYTWLLENYGKAYQAANETGRDISVEKTICNEVPAIMDSSQYPADITATSDEEKREFAEKRCIFPLGKGNSDVSTKNKTNSCSLPSTEVAKPAKLTKVKNNHNKSEKKKCRVIVNEHPKKSSNDSEELPKDNALLSNEVKNLISFDNTTNFFSDPDTTVKHNHENLIDQPIIFDVPIVIAQNRSTLDLNVLKGSSTSKLHRMAEQIFEEKAVSKSPMEPNKMQQTKQDTRSDIPSTESSLESFSRGDKAQNSKVSTVHEQYGVMTRRSSIQCEPNRKTLENNDSKSEKNKFEETISKNMNKSSNGEELPKDNSLLMNEVKNLISFDGTSNFFSDPDTTVEHNQETLFEQPIIFNVPKIKDQDRSSLDLNVLKGSSTSKLHRMAEQIFQEKAVPKNTIETNKMQQIKQGTRSDIPSTESSWEIFFREEKTLNSKVSTVHEEYDVTRNSSVQGESHRETLDLLESILTSKAGPTELSLYPGTCSNKDLNPLGRSVDNDLKLPKHRETVTQNPSALESKIDQVLLEPLSPIEKTSTNKLSVMGSNFSPQLLTNNQFQQVAKTSSTDPMNNKVSTKSPSTKNLRSDVNHNSDLHSMQKYMEQLIKSDKESANKAVGFTRSSSLLCKTNPVSVQPADKLQVKKPSELPSSSTDNGKLHMKNNELPQHEKALSSNLANGQPLSNLRPSSACQRKNDVDQQRNIQNRLHRKDNAVSDSGKHKQPETLGNKGRLRSRSTFRLKELFNK